MKKLHLYIFLFLVLLAVVAQQVFVRVGNIVNQEMSSRADTVGTSTDSVGTSSTQTYNLEIRQLVKAYPEFLSEDPNDPNGIVWKEDGTRMQFDDGVIGKDIEKMLNEPDLQDQMEMRYEPGDNFNIRKDYDPGRVRFEPFFKKMYGATEEEEQAHLETVYWLPQNGNKLFLVSSVNGVSQKLQAVSNGLDELVQQPDKEYLLKYLKNPGGAFNWRTVVDTDRLSPHSFGIAFDINVDYSDYWEWAVDGEAVYKNQIPMEIVNVFEKHGFIWGGKWYHYDTMHFEYRPELLEKSK